VSFSRDQPAGGMIYQLTGVSSYVYNRLRIFKRVYVAASSDYYFPRTDSANSKVLFKVLSCTAPRRTAPSIAQNAAENEIARASGKYVSYQKGMQQTRGVKWHSPFSAPTPAVRDTCSYLKDR